MSVWLGDEVVVARGISFVYQLVLVARLVRRVSVFLGEETNYSKGFALFAISSILSSTDLISKSNFSVGNRSTKV